MKSYTDVREQQFLFLGMIQSKDQDTLQILFQDHFFVRTSGVIELILLLEDLR